MATKTQPNRPAAKAAKGKDQQPAPETAKAQVFAYLDAAPKGDLPTLADTRKAFPSLKPRTVNHLHRRWRKVKWGSVEQPS